MKNNGLRNRIQWQSHPIFTTLKVTKGYGLQNWSLSAGQCFQAVILCHKFVWYGHPRVHLITSHPSIWNRNIRLWPGWNRGSFPNTNPVITMTQPPNSFVEEIKVSLPLNIKQISSLSPTMGHIQKLGVIFQTTTRPWIICDCYLSMNVTLN